jgi:hypothetical protein
MSDVITLNGIEVELGSDAAREFLVNAVRAGEGLVDDTQLMESYELTAEDLQNITTNKKFIRALQKEREHRVRSGIAAREAAAKEFATAPQILGKLLRGDVHPKHAVDIHRELRATVSGAENQPNPATQSEYFHIVINLGSDTEVYYKPIAVGVEDDAQPKLSGQPKLTIIANEGRDE